MENENIKVKVNEIDGDEKIKITVNESDVPLNTAFDDVVSSVTSTNYETISNKPQIEGTTLIGNKTFEDLGLHILTNSELEEILV